MIDAATQDIPNYLNIMVAFGESAGPGDEILWALKPAFPYAQKGTLDKYDIDTFEHSLLP